jgi:hypothetical protein
MEAIVWKAKEEEDREKRSKEPMGNRFGQRNRDFLERARAQDGG